MDVWVKGAKKKPFVFRCHTDHATIENYCAAIVISHFRKLAYAATWDTTQNCKNSAIDVKDLLKAILKKSPKNCGIYFFGDKKGGEADRYIFPCVTKEPFKIERTWYVCELSDYYRNSNTRHMCRHMIVTKSSKKPVGA